MADNVATRLANREKNSLKRNSQNKKSPYLHLSIQERIDRARNDQSFINFCALERKKPNFEINLEIAEKIAQIDVSGISIDKKLIDNQNLFSKKQIMADIREFYQLIDSLDPNGINLTDRLNFSCKYFTLKKGKCGRSYCESGVDKNGNKNRDVYIEVEGRIGDTINAIHEAGHSLTDEFQKCVRAKDIRVAEIPTVITDQLSSLFLIEKYPQYTENILENSKFTNFFNVKKARECLMDALLVKGACGEITWDETNRKYGHLFNQFPEMLRIKLEQIETYRFHPMFEIKYLIPQAIALELKERYKENPQLVAKQLKHIIKESASITEDDVLAYLGLPNKMELTEQYIAKFFGRIKELEQEQLEVKQNKETLQGEVVIDYSGKEIIYKGCPGCAYANHEFSLECGMAYENERFTLSYDWELPIYGFFVVCPKRHIQYFTELTKLERDEMFDIADKTITILKDLGVCDEFNLVLEEKVDRHLHLWIMPRHQMFKDMFGDITDNIGEIFDYAIKNWKTKENIQNINKLSKQVREGFIK